MPITAQPQHPVLDCADAVASHLAGVRDAQPLFMTVAEKESALLRIAAAKAGLAELEARVLACAGDVAEQHGARDAGAWLAHATGVDPRHAHADLALALELERRPRLASALAEGRVSVAQARVIVAAVADLPQRLGEDVRDRAVESLVGFAADHGPRELRRLGRHILDVVAPEVAEAEDAARLANLEEAARQQASLRTRAIGNGMARTTWVHPVAEAERLMLYVDSYTNPRRPADAEAAGGGVGDWERTPAHRRRAWAASALLEHLDVERIPATGGVATQVVVTVTLESLRSDLATATLAGRDEEQEISAHAARRLACEAQILPVVLGGQGQILDAGRSRRLFAGVQRRLIQTRWMTCVGEGCTVPATWCEIHHLGTPWAAGGATDLADGVPACGLHHHRFHDPGGYSWDRLPTGRVRFHRRT